MTEDEKRATPDKVANDDAAGAMRDLGEKMGGLKAAIAAEELAARFDKHPFSTGQEEQNLMKAGEAPPEPVNEPWPDDKSQVTARLRSLGYAVALLLGVLFGRPAEASPFPWNPFSATMRADNTMTVRGSVTGFQPDVPLGGCTFELHHSESLNGVQVVLDATRGRDCKAIRMALAKVLDPEMARIIVKAKGRVVVSETGDGIGEEARSQLLSTLVGITCTATRGAHPSLALDPLQRVKQELDAAAKRIPDGSLVLAKARAEITVAQDDLEQAASLTGGEPVCNMVGVSELRKVLESLPAATRQTLHATGVQVDRD